MIVDGAGGRICEEECKTFWFCNISMRRFCFSGLVSSLPFKTDMLVSCFSHFPGEEIFGIRKGQTKSIHVLENVSFYLWHQMYTTNLKSSHGPFPDMKSRS